MRYCPASSLTTDRTFSMSAGLAASTVTPGSTAPDGSLTTPVMAACANAAAGTSKTISRSAADRRTNARMGFLLTGGVSSGDQECAVSQECGGFRRYEAEIERARNRRDDGGAAVRRGDWKISRPPARWAEYKP